MRSLGFALLRRVNQHLGIHSRDWPLLLLLLLHVFVALSFVISLRSLNSGVLLCAFDATVYPWYFLSEALLSFALSLLYSRFTGRLFKRQTEFISFMGCFAGLLVLARLMFYQDFIWSYFVFPTLFESLVGLLMIQAWGLYGDCVDSRKARRVFPLIGLGGTCGGVCGGWLVSSLAHRWGTENLLVGEALVLIVLMACTLPLFKQSQVKYKEPSKKQPTQASQSTSQPSIWTELQTGLQKLYSNQLLIRALVVLISIRVAATILDYQMQLQLKSNLDQNGITAYMGNYFAWASLVTLIVQLTIENQIINRKGIVWGLGSTPLSMGIGLGGFLLAPSLWSITAAKFMDQITRNSLYKTAIELIYIPFESQSRQRLRVMVNSILGLATVPLASLTIMLFSQATQLLTCIALGFASLGFLFSILLQKPYTKKLHGALMQRRLLVEDIYQTSAQEELAPETIENMFTRQDPELLLFALDLLKTKMITVPKQAAHQLIFHEHPYVRSAYLSLLKQQEQAPDLQVVLDLLQHENDPQVQKSCLEVLRKWGDESLNPLLLNFVQSPDLGVQAEATLVLFTRGGIEGILQGAEVLKSKLSSQDARELVIAAYMIGEIGIRYFRNDFLDLVNHRYLSVQQAALKAANKGLPPEMIPQILAFLGKSQLRQQAQTALAAYPSSMLLSECIELIQHSSTKVSHKLEIIRLLSHFSEADVISYLFDLMAEPDILIKYQVLQGLNYLRRVSNFDSDPFENRIQAQLQREFYYGYHYIYLLNMIRKNPLHVLRSSLMQSELKSRIDFVQEMIFRLLSLLHPPQIIYKAFLNYRSQSSHFKSLSLEVLSYTLESDLAQYVLTFLDDLPSDSKISFAREHQLIDETIGLNWWQSAVIQEDVWFRQIAQWCRDFDSNEDNPMFNIIDKMFLFKQTPVFAKFSAEQLYPIVLAAKEVYVPAHHLVLKQGQPAEAFYIISSGSVAIERSGIRVTTLGEKECFGELEVLNADPSLAAVRTLSECEFLMIAREDFLDLVNQYPDFSRGLLEVLSERLAAHVVKLSSTRPLGTGSLWAEVTMNMPDSPSN